MKKWLKDKRQFVIAALIFSLFGTGVTFALPYLPSDAQLDPACAPGDTNCYVQILPALTAGSVVFSDGSTLAQDNANFSWDDSTNQLYAKYAKTDSTEYPNSSFSKVYNVLPNNSFGLGIFIGKSMFSGGAAQSPTSNPTATDNLPGGVAIGQNILTSFTGAWGISNSVFIGGRLFTGAVGDSTLNVAIGSAIGGTGDQNQGVFIGAEVLGNSTAASGYDAFSGHKNVGVGRQSLSRANGGYNTAIGTLALARVTTGSRNAALGVGAGNGIDNGVNSALTGSNNTFLGALTSWSTDGITNATAVGYSTILAQSNTVILGTSADVGIGTNTPSFKLHVVGNTGIEGKLSIYNLTNNTTIGYTAGNAVTSGLRNVFLGYEAGKASTSNSDNVIIGYRAVDEKVGLLSRSIMIGVDTAGNSITNSDVVDSVLIGYQANFNADDSYNIVAIGKGAHYGATADGNNSPSNNIAIGTDSMHEINSGSDNVAVGPASLYAIDYGASNVAIGSSALSSLQFGSFNVAIGQDALSNTEGTGIIGIGFGAGDNITGDDNIAIGNDALTVSSGTYNIAMGSSALTNNSTGYSNVAIGKNAFKANTDGFANVVIGADALQLQTTGNYNVVVGEEAGYIASGSYNTYLGSGTGYSVTGSHNVALGEALGGDHADYSIGIGYALPGLNVANSYDIGIGYGAGGSVTTGIKNVFIGSNNAGDWVISGSKNVFLGSYNAQTLGTSVSNHIVLSDGDGNVRFLVNNLGNASIGGDITPDYRLDVDTDSASTYAGGFFNDGNNDNRWGIVIQAGADTPNAGKWIQFNDGDGGDMGSICAAAGVISGVCTPSDIRLKENITDTNLSLSALLSIKVRDFSYIADGSHRIVHGFVAQELQSSYPDAVVIPQNPEEYWKVSYSQLTPLIVKSIQELDLKLSDITSLDINNSNSLASKIKLFLADTGNGIEKIFSNEVHTKKLCLDDVCVTKQELAEMLNSRNSNNNPQDPAPSTSSDSSIQEEQPSVVEENATPEPSPEEPVLVNETEVIQ